MTLPASTNGARPSGFIQSVDRALSILEYFSLDRPEGGVSDIARTLGLNKSTAFGILCTLERRGYVEQNPETGRYRLGLKMLEMGNIKLAGFDLTRAAHPILRELADRMEETVHLAIYDRGEVVYIDKVEADNAITISSFIGKRNPSYCTGVGKCLLAFQRDEEIERIILEGLPARTARTITDPAAFRKELAAIRETGRGHDEEEFVAGLFCAAAPVRDNRGNVCAAISVSAPTIRTSREKALLMSDAVDRAARTISTTLGFNPKS